MSKNRITLSDTIVEETIIAAVEGGINYWAEIGKYDPDKPRKATIKYQDPKTDEVKISVINKALLQEGADLIMNNRDFAPGIPHLTRALYDEFEIDADSADALVQAGLFKELVYG